MARKRSSRALLPIICEVGDCKANAIKGFRIYERVDSGGPAEVILTSSTNSCVGHLEMVQESYAGKPGLRVVDFSR